MFTHESGLHVDGLLKDRRNYQGVDPALLGREHHLVLGKHSGRHGVMAVFSQLGYALSEPEIKWLLVQLREFVERYKHSPGENELHQLVRNYRSRSGFTTSQEVVWSGF